MRRLLDCLKDPGQGEGREGEHHGNAHRQPVEIAFCDGGTTDVAQRAHASTKGVSEAPTLARVEQDERDKPERHDQVKRDKNACDQDEYLSLIAAGPLTILAGRREVWGTRPPLASSESCLFNP